MRVALGCVLAVLAVTACRDQDRDPYEKAALQLTPEEQARILAEIEAKRRADELARENRQLGLASAEAEAPRQPPAAASDEPSAPAAVELSGDAPFILDGLVDVGPAGPVTASSDGLIFVNQENVAWLAALGAPATGTEPGPTRIGLLDDKAGPFPLRRGPTRFADHVYWVSHERLFRRKLGPRGAFSGLEILANDARIATRVAVPVGTKERLRKLPAMAAYIARPSKEGGNLTARLWTEGQSTQLLTEDGVSNSVSLIATERGLFALTLDARTGMTPVQMRSIELKPGAAPEIGPSKVVWVGGGCQPFTELLSYADESTAGTFLALEKDMLTFGLVRLDLSEPAEQCPAAWTLYQNGIDPAPFAVARICGEPMLAFAAPSTTEHRALQDLSLARIGKDGPENPVVVASARAFFEITLSEAPRGGLIGYVADKRTWARRIRCKPR